MADECDRGAHGKNKQRMLAGNHQVNNRHYDSASESINEIMLFRKLKLATRDEDLDLTKISHVHGCVS